MKISVIVPNHGRNLTELRRSLANSTHGEYDLIVIDRGLERSVQRNMGISEADGRILLILDSDHTVSPGLMEELVDLVKQGYSNIYIPEIVVPTSFFDKVRNFEREFYTGTAVDVPRCTVNENVPLFDETMNGPEDSDWSRRLKGTRAISENVFFHHDHLTLKQYLKKKAYYTKSMRRFIEKWPNDKILNPIWRCFLVFVEKGKYKKIIRHPILFMSIMFVIFLRGIIYVTQK